MKIVYLRKKPWDQHNKSLEVRSGRVFRFDLEMNVKADNNTEMTLFALSVALFVRMWMS